MGYVLAYSILDEGRRNPVMRACAETRWRSMRNAHKGTWEEYWLIFHGCLPKLWSGCWRPPAYIDGPKHDG
jgi:hypothetical protein